MIQVWKEQVRKENLICDHWQELQVVLSVGRESQGAGDYLEPNLDHLFLHSHGFYHSNGMVCPWRTESTCISAQFPAWRLAALPLRAAVVQGAGLRCCAGGLTHVQVPEVLWSRTCCSHLRDVWHSQHPSPGLAPGASPLPKWGVGTADRARAAAVPGALPVPLAPGELGHPCSLTHPTGTCGPWPVWVLKTHGFGISLPWRLISFKSLIWWTVNDLCKTENLQLRELKEPAA